MQARSDQRSAGLYLAGNPFGPESGLGAKGDERGFRTLAILCLERRLQATKLF
jgi:hypothetical protein